ALARRVPRGDDQAGRRHREEQGRERHRAQQGQARRRDRQHQLQVIAHLLLIRGRRPVRAPSPNCVEGAMREDNEARARDARLARMKWLASGLLVLAGGIYVAAQALQPRYAWLYYVAVTAEAAMVGAIADWFAVTALFHHPFGLRFVPHTAIIPRNKQRIATGLSHFIETNFLTSAAVVQRIRDFQPARTLYGWLLRSENAEAVATYVTRLTAYGLNAFDDERVRNYLAQTIARRLQSADVASAAAQLLDVLTENRRHHELLDAALRALDEVLARPDTQAYLAGEVARSAPLLKWLSDLFQLKLDERAALKIVEVAVQKIKEVRESQAWIDEQIVKAAPPLIEEHRAKIGRFIEDQIMSWQERRLVVELERHIGPDLQYIRINGTLVGGLAGLLIAVATQLAAR